MKGFDRDRGLENKLKQTNGKIKEYVKETFQASPEIPRKQIGKKAMW